MPNLAANIVDIDQEITNSLLYTHADLIPMSRTLVRYFNSISTKTSRLRADGLKQLLFWRGKGTDPRGDYKSARQLSEEIDCTLNQAVRLFEHFEDSGFITRSIHIVNGSQTTFYILHLDIIDKAVAPFRPHKPTKTKAPNHLAVVRDASCSSDRSSTDSNTDSDKPVKTIDNFDDLKPEKPKPQQKPPKPKAQYKPLNKKYPQSYPKAPRNTKTTFQELTDRSWANGLVSNSMDQTHVGKNNKCQYMS